MIPRERIMWKFPKKFSSFPISVEKAAFSYMQWRMLSWLFSIHRRTITLKMMVRYNYLKNGIFVKKKLEKNVEKKNFETKLLITKIYNTINQCDTIFAPC